MKDILFNELILFYQVYNIQIIALLILNSVVFLLLNNKMFFWLLQIINCSLIIYIGGWIYECIVFESICISITIALYIYEKRRESIQNSKNPFRVTLRTTRLPVIIENINAGVSIFAASGGGKSVGPIRSLAQHFAKHKFSGIINDYKNFELTEELYPIFKEEGVELCVFAPHKPTLSVRINLIEPRYIPSEAELNQIVESLLLNLYDDSSKGGNESYFRNGGISLLSATIWAMKEKDPDNCNLPFIMALLLNTEGLHEYTIDIKGNPIQIPYGRLIKFINSSKRATIVGSHFLSATASNKTTGLIVSSLAQALSKIASPEMFYLLSKDEFHLDINADDNRKVLSLVNNPKKENFISPILAMITECCFTQISERNRKPSFILLDEAPTLKLANLGKKVSTLRSYGISFVYCMQDKVQGQVQYDGKEYFIKEILANLSVQFFGKINDPDTGKYYQNYFEMIEKEQRSVSKSDSILFSRANDSRVTTSKKEQAEYRSFEFFKLKPGEFIMFSSGKANNFRFKYKELPKELPPKKRDLTENELDNFYNKVLERGKEYFEKIEKEASAFEEEFI